LVNLHHRSNFDGTTSWPGFGDAQCLVKVGHVDLNIAANDLIALNEGAVVDDRLSPTLEAHSGRGKGRLELVARTEPGTMLREPAAHLGILRAAGFLGQVYPGLLPVYSTLKRQFAYCHAMSVSILSLQLSCHSPLK